jgi:hypothetical protein
MRTKKKQINKSMILDQKKTLLNAATILQKYFVRERLA